jgi:release factor glutamine methyltransferase
MASHLTIRALLDAATARLGERSETPLLDAELLLAHALPASRARLTSHPEDAATPEAAARFDAFLARRERGEPLAYITGHREFWTLRLQVSPAVLVPRPETELLVERALALFPAAPFRVADLGTGSGAIALALASERPAWEITATDVSEAALAVARTNARALALERVKFVAGEWLEPLRSRRFDLLVSNPPYVAAGDPALAQPSLQHEPAMALASGPEGLDAIRVIARDAPAHLERGGWLLLEHGATQADAVARELVVRGFRHVRSRPDLAGPERITEGQWT